jgi:hypothetical protein
MRIFVYRLAPRCSLAALVLLASAASPLNAGAANVERRALDPADEAYLRELAADTWACIAHFVAPETGLPFDTSKRGEFTSVSNIGYYVACCGVAAKMGLVDTEEAAQRVNRVLNSYESFEHWKGFSQSWNSVRTLKPSPSDTMISLLDSANMVAGFVVAGQALPQTRARVDAALAKLDWSAFYDPEDGRLFGGYDLARGKIDPGWHIGDYAGDGRMAAFWAIAVGAAPAESWGRLSRRTESHYGFAILQPAWMGGGLFMQVQDGLFLEERGTLAGKSASDFAYVQMIYANANDLPAWGWSACTAPDGRYLGWGGMESQVVTPHATGMAVMYYPHKAVACLRKLDAMGARVPFRENGKTYRFGFRDSVNLETTEVSDLYLPPLDQAMLFFALANVLEDGIVQQLFASHPTAAKGIALIPEYQTAPPDSRLVELRRRDREPLSLPPRAASSGRAAALIDDFEDENNSTNKLGGDVVTWQRDANDETVSFKLSRESMNGRGALKLEYDVDSPNRAYGGLRFGLNGLDASGCNTLKFRARGDAQEIKLELHGAGGVAVTRIHELKPDTWTDYALSFKRFSGMVTDWRSMDRLMFVFEDGACAPKVGSIWLDDIELVRQ